MEPYEEVVRQMIRHENEVMNHRTMWLLTLQGLLFTALGFAWDKRDAHTLIYVFCVTGISVAGSSWTVLSGADRATHRLRKWWTDRHPNDAGPGVVGHWDESWHHVVLLPWRSLPVLFIVAWLCIMYFNGHRPLAPTETQKPPPAARRQANRAAGCISQRCG